ncbi:hypothetical protein ACIOYT_32290 [Streptomyces halstedii]|uniref:hypothetical protein n=1 Tax=Streptomyces halstedii TaxID=1944 RepID=UPI00381C5BEF
MTPLEGTAKQPSQRSRMIAYISAVTGLSAVIAATCLGVTGHPEAAQAVGVIGGAALATGGVTVTVNVKR